MRLTSILVGMMVVMLAGCSSQSTLTDEEVERERTRSNQVHEEMDRETR